MADKNKEKCCCGTCCKVLEALRRQNHTLTSEYVAVRKERDGFAYEVLALRHELERLREEGNHATVASNN